jgi:hypothetical protein
MPRGGRIDKDILHARQALPLGKRINANLQEIEWPAGPGHGTFPAISHGVAWLMKRSLAPSSMASRATELKAELPSQNQINACVSINSLIPRNP